MSDGYLLQIEPLELQFPFELKKQISCYMQLTNNSDRHVAFKVKTTNPKKYCVRPNTGVVEPHSACDVIVTMQAQKEAPPDMQCRDKFLLQSVVVGTGIEAKNITPEMFNKESGNQVEECRLKVSYFPPLQPSSPVREGSEEESSSRVSLSDNGTVNQTSESNLKSKTNVEPQESTSEGKALISKLAEEKMNTIQQNNKLQQELLIGELDRMLRSISTAGKEVSRPLDRMLMRPLNRSMVMRLLMLCDRKYSVDRSCTYNSSMYATAQPLNAMRLLAHETGLQYSCAQKSNIDVAFDRQGK